ncbi:MAG: hypothetical protein ABH846_00415 [Patescibacteria group bacterium]
MEMREQLLSDHQDLSVLSTPGVNFLYLSEWVYDLKHIDPEIYLRIAKEHLDKKDTHSIKRIIYLLTHTIIGETKFYSHRIKRQKVIYRQMMEFVDELIMKSTNLICLDAKVESLLCARLLGYKMKSERMILVEVEKSVSSEKVLVDLRNIYRGKTPMSLSASEHRNILFVMAMQPTPIHLQIS